MRIFFTFENALPSREADAEVFATTASCLAPLAAGGAWLHLPVLGREEDRWPSGMTVVGARAPAGPAALRHFVCGLTMAAHREFRRADLVYTRNLWIASMALLFGQRVVFDHYRPWPDQIPPLQPWIRALMGHRRFLLNICHSEYTRGAYRALGVARSKLVCIRNGFDPGRFGAALPVEVAKERIGVPAARKTVVYAGRVNGRKGLDLLIEAASRLPELLFVLVGATGEGTVEKLAAACANVRLVPWQSPERLGAYLAAADVLVIPPSTRPLAEFGTTVLPLKLFLYMASGRPILAGATNDVQEVLRHGENAFLCRPDCPDALAAGLRTLTADAALAARLGARALADSNGLTWEARARRIMAAIEERVRSSPASEERHRPSLRAWLGQCRRWLVHAVRRRSMVLPPAGLLPGRLAPIERP